MKCQKMNSCSKSNGEMIVNEFYLSSNLKLGKSFIRTVYYVIAHRAFCLIDCMNAMVNDDEIQNELEI